MSDESTGESTARPERNPAHDHTVRMVGRVALAAEVEIIDVQA